MSQASNASHQTSTRLSVFVFGVLILVSAFTVASWRLKWVSIASVHASTMTPVIREHDAVIINTASFSSLHSDDIVGYRDPLKPNRILVERVVQIDTKKGLLTLRADNGGKTTQIDNSLLLGTVRYRIAHAGFGLDFLRSKLGLATCVYLPAFVIIGQELKRLSGEYKRQTYRLFGSLRYR